MNAKQRTTKRNPQNNLVLKTESGIEQFKQDLFDAATENTGLLTIAYANWMNAQINNERRLVRELSDAKFSEGRKHSQATLQAWERAHELFRTLTPLLLDGLIRDIAGQIEIEFANVDELAASDVPANLRGVNLFELMGHTN